MIFFYNKGGSSVCGQPSRCQMRQAGQWKEKPSANTGPGNMALQDSITVRDWSTPFMTNSWFDSLENLINKSSNEINYPECQYR